MAPVRKSSRSGRSAASGRRLASAVPFSDFIARDELRQARTRSRRRTIVISVVIHVVVFGGLLAYSIFDIDDLWGTAVEVKVFAPEKAPSRVQPSRFPTMPPVP